MIFRNLKFNYSLIVPLLFMLNTTVPTQQVYAQSQVSAGDKMEKIHLDLKFSSPLLPIHTEGRGLCRIEDGILKTKEEFACFGDSSWTNYEIKFSASAPATASQVQIWAGFRAHSRNDRYMMGFRGGNQNTLYLARMGYMGTDEFLALRPLGFHPTPGKWYEFRIEVCNDRIRIFLNNEHLPRIDVTDKNARFSPSGKVLLGGSWIETAFDHLSVTALRSGYLTGKKVEELSYELANHPARENKEQRRRIERAAWQPVKVNAIGAGRTEIPLTGKWLFMPANTPAPTDANSGSANPDPVNASPDPVNTNLITAASPAASDKDWHVLSVPAFWNPIRIWLHGEMFGPHSKGASDNYFRMETERCEAYTFNYKTTDEAWYRQWIELPSSAAARSFELVFDAVSKIAEVYINGIKAGSHIGMFGSFNVDGTGLFRPGKNLIAVKVSRKYGKDIEDAGKIIDVAVSVPVTNKMLKDLPHGFYGDDPAGIWQPVRLIISDPVRIEDVFIQPNLTGATFQFTIKNMSKTQQTFSVTTGISDRQDDQQEGKHDWKHNGTNLYNGLSLANATIEPGETNTFTGSVKDLKPKYWSPDAPNLYDFRFHLATNQGLADDTTIISGFRTFESKDGYLWLNGIRYWLRGANQTPFALAPDNDTLANTFFQLMKAGNISVTRTHTAPYNEVWMNAADRNGIGISFEGTWPWLMLQSSMPDAQLIDIWANEFMDLLKKYRNHPSLLIWTVNNEMKFYDNDPDFERAKRKMRIISEVVKRMRKIDPTRPICFDSNYKRNTKKFGADFFKDIDDGDIDDVHSYINWYDYTLFKQFNGEFQTQNHNDGRPLISQEMSTGYPNAETGHATRFYTIVHQTPQSLIGDLAYENNDPAWFLTTHSFITGELAEALRRSNDKSAGFLHFALLTWFRNVYDAHRIEPYPTYYAMKRALQPVLVSAELWGRHFYAGEKLPARICIVNDQENGSALSPSTLEWQLMTDGGTVMASGKVPVPELAHYGREWVSPEILIPARLPNQRVEARLVLRLTRNNTLISSNEYSITLAEKAWSIQFGNHSALNDEPADIGHLAGKTSASSSTTTLGDTTARSGKNIVLVDFSNMTSVFDFLKIKYTAASSVSAAMKLKADAYVFSGIDPSGNCSVDELRLIRALVAGGGRVLLLDAPAAAKAIYPEYISGWITPSEGDIVNLAIPESPLFDQIAPLDLRYFNNNKREVPTVCHAAFSICRDPHLQALAMQTKVHGYVEGNMAKRSTYMAAIRGFPILQVSEKGTMTISAISLEKGATDPIAGRLLTNMVNDLFCNPIFKTTFHE